jgi:hypothetical protein
MATANVLLAPGLARRELVGPTGRMTESILVAPTLPLVWLQYTPSGALGSEGLELVVDSGGTNSPSVVLSRVRSGLLLDAGEGRATLVAVPGAQLEIEHGSRGSRLIVPAVPELASLTVVLAVGTPLELRGALSAAAHTSAHAIRASAGPVEGLALETGVEEIDDGVAWARVRTEGLAFRGRPTIVTGLAALAASDEVSARQTLEAFPPDSLEHALLAGRFAGTFGASGPAAAAAATLRAAASRTASGELRRLAAGALAEGLRYAAPPPLISALSALSSEPAAPTPTGRRLPVVGGPARPVAVGADSEARWLQSLLAGGPAEPPGRAVHADTITLRRSAATFSTDPDLAWRGWREVLSEGLRLGPWGPATWDAGQDGESEVRCAELLLTLVHGMLGLVVDAPVGRIRLAPRLPGHLRTFGVRGLAVGTARLRLDYESSGRVRRFTVSPEEASVPPLLILEPTIRGRARSARIDGKPADLDVHAVGDFSVVPVQLPVEGPRVLEVEVEAASR